METDWVWFWTGWGDRLNLTLFLDLQDWGVLFAVGWRSSQLSLRAQVGPAEVHFDADFGGYVDDIDYDEDGDDEGK